MGYKIRTAAYRTASKSFYLRGYGSRTVRNHVGNRAEEMDVSCYLPLYKAIITEDWEAAKEYFDRDRNTLTAKITVDLNTPLHVAATGRSIRFIENLVELMTKKELAQPNVGGYTAFHRIAGIDDVEIAKLLVKKNPDLPYMWNQLKQLPVHLAAISGHKDMVLYLLEITKEDIEPKPYEGPSGSQLVSSLITSGLYDVALLVLQRHPDLAVADPTPLNEIAEKPSAFPSGAHLKFWQRFIYRNVPAKLEMSSNIQDGGDVESAKESPEVSAKVCRWFPFFRGSYFISGLWKVIDTLAPQIKHIRETKLMHHQTLELVKIFCREIARLDSQKAASLLVTPFLTAAKFGIHEIAVEILVAYPDAIIYADEDGHTALHLAVMNRQENIFNLIYQMRYDSKQFLSILKDEGENSVLHLAGNLAPKHRLNLVSGAALQMQRELQWYKVVETLVPPSYKEHKNKEGETPRMVFTEAHKELIKEGEKWLRDTSGSCTMAAALIATVVFAAAITVPGDYGDNGLPYFLKEKGFIVFAISDVVSLFSSLSSLLMFLSILTSRYAESDFLNALPKRLVIGLVMLFLSITSLMVAFSATIYLVFGFGQGKTWVLIPVGLMACVPVTLFVSLQFPLLVDMIRSTFGRGVFRKQGKLILA